MAAVDDRWSSRDNYLSPHDSVPLANRFLVALCIIILVEAIRALLYPSDYNDSSWRLVILFSIGVNTWFTWWTLPGTILKTTVTTAYSQFTLPYVVVAFVKFGLALYPALLGLTKALIGGKPSS